LASVEFLGAIHPFGFFGFCLSFFCPRLNVMSVFHPQEMDAFSAYFAQFLLHLLLEMRYFRNRFAARINFCITFHRFPRAK
jgi:hypothetical protein